MLIVQQSEQKKRNKQREKEPPNLKAKTMKPVSFRITQPVLDSRKQALAHMHISAYTLVHTH